MSSRCIVRPTAATLALAAVGTWAAGLWAAGASAAEPFTFGSESAVTKASELRGRIVETRDGEELGRVHDFAVDLPSGRIAYVVVSVGSFLIQDSLIAVAPDALRVSADADGRLVLETDAEGVRAAERFSAGNWPVRADVLAVAGEQPAESRSSPGEEDNGAERSRRGTATITSDTKTATLSAGERSIRVQDRPAPVQQEEASPLPPGERPDPASPFGRLDRDGNGTLNRAEIAHELTRNDNYSDIDVDGNGTIDPGEFDAFLTRRGKPPDPEASPVTR